MFNRFSYSTLIWTAVILIAVAVPYPAAAHRLRPAIVTLTLETDATWSADVVLNVEAVLAGIGPEHADTSDSPNAARYEDLRSLAAAELEPRIKGAAADYLNGFNVMFDGERSAPELLAILVPPVGDVERERLTTLSLRGKVPPSARSMVFSYAQEFGTAALRFKRAGEDVVRTAFLGPGQPSEAFSLAGAVEAKSFTETVVDYMVLGFTHILPKGLDHILFVLGIYLLSQRLKPLLYQVTAFTIAHSITLALSLYGIISLPSSIVEPLIALSIVYVAVENIVTRELKPWRIAIVFLFGLLHGLGFAGVLRSLGLPENDYVTALIAFNVGVELGQLAVISAAFLAVGLWFRNRPWYRRAVVIPASLVIAMTGAWWTVERVFL